MALTTKSFSTLVSDQVAAIQGASAKLVDFSVGSILLAAVQAVAASIGLWLQGLILQLLTVTRLGSSFGTDVDSWLADFAFARLGAIAAVGVVTFSRVTPSIAAVIPVSAILSSSDGTQKFTVIANTTNGAYSIPANGYLLAINVTSVNVTVQAVTPGTGANVSIGSISVIQTGISGIDSVTNAAAFTSGVNAETDAAVKIRFQSYLASLSAGTEGAYTFAISSLNQNLQSTIQETPTTSPEVTITVDDGTGAISSPLLALAQAAVAKVRPAGITVGVFAATKLTANVNMTIVTATGYVHATVVGQVALALTAFINAVGLGNTLSYMQLATVAFAIGGVTDVTNVTLNSGTADMVPTPAQTIKSGTIAVA